MPNFLPILYSSPMVCAVIADMKSKTRRVIKGLPEGTYRVDTDDGIHFYAAYGRRQGNALLDFEEPIKPAYIPGDILWVRETWRVGAWDHKLGAVCVDYAADGFADPTWRHLEKVGYFDRLSRQSSEDAYAAGVIDENGQCRWERGKGPTRWRSSIFMPKEATRIFLRVTGVRAERLQNITQSEAIDEGVLLYDGWETKEYKEQRAAASASWTKPPLGFSPCERFEHLWNTLNAARGYGWDTNPWVWVYTFERITREEAQA